MKIKILLLILIVFLIGCVTEVADAPAEETKPQEPEVKTIHIEEKEEKPIEKQKETEVKNTSEEYTLMETPPYYFELNSNQMDDDTIITIKFDDDGKLDTGILHINGKKIEISPTNPTFILYIGEWVERGGNYYQIKEYKSSSAKINEINIKNGGNYVSLVHSPGLK